MSEQRGGPGLGHGRKAPRPPLPEHLRLRRWMLGLSSPVVLILLLGGSLLLGVTFGNLHARAAYDDGRYATAADRFSYQVPFTSGVVEPWKAWFNAGTAEFQTAEHFRAVEDLREAHRLVPPGTTDADGNPDPTTPECRVRTNLSLALEAMGDDAQEAGDPAMALVHYNEAMDMIGPCTSDGQSESDEQQQDQSQDPSQDQSQDPSQDQSQDPSQDQSQDPSDQPSDGQDGSESPSQEPGQDQSQQPGEDPSQQPDQGQNQQPDQGQQQPDQGQNQQPGGGTPDQTEQRQRQKADQAQRDAQGGSSQDQPGGPGQDDPSGGQGPGNEDAPSGGGDEQQQPTDPKQRELEERNRQADRDRQEQEQQQGGGFGGGQNW
ncbi:hypothetical protein ATJ97_2589 [Georgenia soli]|uniref:Tetratricopeptide repeat protein n=1 Tax=Georgenia soli TaxID=638953 RepID=A0A2A9EPC5_9MICO|nr:hypothetical protein [Georgenia soli]PFG40069.1 hypothetical protein ATJ97_2589 [Georgenia soli]